MVVDFFWREKRVFGNDLFFENNKCQKIVGQPVSEVETAAFLVSKSFPSKGKLRKCPFYTSIKSLGK